MISASTFALRLSKVYLHAGSDGNGAAWPPSVAGPRYGQISDFYKSLASELYRCLGKCTFDVFINVELLLKKVQPTPILSLNTDITLMAYKILTVDDSKMVRMIVGKTFKPLVSEVLEAGGGNDGLSMAEKHIPDLIFLDITMADMTGLDVLEKLRGNPAIQHIPVVMLTAESGTKSVERADALKVSGYLAKPFTGEQLIEQARKILSF